MGEHDFTCAEYCGKGHSDMQGTLIVENQADFDKFIATGGTEWEEYKTHMADWGKIQWERKGCNSCHTLDGTRARARVGRASGARWRRCGTDRWCWWTRLTSKSPRNMPQAKIVDGFEPIMPTFQGLIKPHDFEGIVALIKSLQ